MEGSWNFEYPGFFTLNGHRIVHSVYCLNESIDQLQPRGCAEAGLEDPGCSWVLETELKALPIRYIRKIKTLGVLRKSLKLQNDDEDKWCFISNIILLYLTSLRFLSGILIYCLPLSAVAMNISNVNITVISNVAWQRCEATLSRNPYSNCFSLHWSLCLLHKPSQNFKVALVAWSFPCEVQPIIS